MSIRNSKTGMKALAWPDERVGNMAYCGRTLSKIENYCDKLLEILKIVQENQKEVTIG